MNALKIARIKKYVSVFLAVAVVCFYRQAFAYMAVRLSDTQLDAISAEGFDINIDVARQLQQAAGVYQTNTAAISGLAVMEAEINNRNTAQVFSAIGPAEVSQENISCVMATQGNIDSARINNTNIAQIDVSAGTAMVSQSNINALFAPNGDILNSAINNINIATFSPDVAAAQVDQQFINIFVTRENGVVDAVVNNQNIVNSFPNTVINVNSSGTTYQSYTIAGFEVLIGTNANVNFN